MELAKFGLEEHPYDPSLYLPFPDGRHIMFRPDETWNVKEVAKFSAADARALPEYERFWQDFGELVEPTLLAPPVSLADLAALIQTPEAEDFLRRVMLMSIADLLDDFFESEEVKVSLATGAVAGTLAGPRTPGTAFVLGHHTLGNIGGVKGVWGWPRGGMGAIPDAIARAARHHGADIRTGASVARIRVRDGRAIGVDLEDGTGHEAKVVLSGVDPKRTFLGLVGTDHLPADFVRSVSRIRMEAVSFKLNLALRELPDFSAAPGTHMQDHHRSIIDMAPSLDYLERAYDDAKHGRPSKSPYLESVIQTANDPSVAPPGMHTLTISAKFAPFDLAEGTWDATAEGFAERILDVYEGYAPNLRRAIVAKHWFPRPSLRRSTDSPGATCSMVPSCRTRCSPSGPYPGGPSTGRPWGPSTCAVRGPIQAAVSWARRATTPRRRSSTTGPSCEARDGQTSRTWSS